MTPSQPLPLTVDLSAEMLSEIKARIVATICPTFGSEYPGDPPVETRQGRIHQSDFEMLFGYIADRDAKLAEVQDALAQNKEGWDRVLNERVCDRMDVANANARAEKAEAALKEATAREAALSQELRDAKRYFPTLADIDRVERLLSNPSPAATELLKEVEGLRSSLIECEQWAEHCAQHTQPPLKASARKAAKRARAALGRTA